LKKEKRISKVDDNRLNMNSIPESEELIYDWNTIDRDPYSKTSEIEFDDETLRDGLQSPSVKDPSIAEKIEILHLMEEIGIHKSGAVKVRINSVFSGQSGYFFYLL